MLTLPANIAIVGSHRETWFDAPYNDGETEIWAFNSGAMKAPSLDRAFQIHDSIAGVGPKYNQWLRSCEVPVYMREKHADIPSSVAYPFDEVYKLTEHVHADREPLRYLTSSIAYALALAVLENRPKISVYGVELTRQTEYENQRECFTFWLGFAAARGIELDIRCAGRMLVRPIYGKVGL